MKVRWSGSGFSMNEFNDALFLLINASAQPNIFLLWTAKLLAEYAIWLIPLALVIGWLRGSEDTMPVRHGDAPERIFSPHQQGG